MVSEHHLPHEIVSQWEKAVGTLPGWLTKVVRDYSPPVSNTALELVQEWASDSQLTSSIATLNGHGIPDDLPKALHTPYPLFGTHLRLAEHPNCHRDFHELLIRTVGGRRVPKSPDTNGSTFYEDCRVIRKALTYLLDSSTTGVQLRQILVKKINQPGGIPTLKELERTRLLRLLRRERTPGMPSHIRKTLHDSSHLERIGRKTVPTTARHEFLALPAESLVPESPDEQPIPGYHHATSGETPPKKQGEVGPSCSTEPSDPDKPDQYRRRNADFRTRGDDRHALGQLPWLQSVRNTRSPADIHRPPPEHVAEAIRGLHGRKKLTDWAFVWILATTAIPVHRLAKLAIHDERPAPTGAKPNPRVILTDGRLEIPLSDGPSGSPGSANRTVRLPLPSAIVDLCGTFSSCHPFLQSSGHADHTLRRHFHSFPGLMPTCQRIRASAEAVIQGLAPDSVTGLALKGEFGHSSRGAAAYRQTADQNLVDLFRQVCAHWRQKNLIPDQASLDAFPVPTISPSLPLDQHVGSSKVGTTEQFQAVFRHLEQEIDQLVEKTHREKGSSGVAVRTLLDLQHAHAQLTYLAFLLSTGIRPISTRATVRLAGKLWYVQDKDSPGFSERRALPALPEIIDQVLRQRAFTEMLCKSAPLRRMRLNTRPNEESDVPLWLELSGRTLTMRRMKQADIDNIFGRFGLASRATRHTFVNALRPSIPETELHSLLGHSGGGWQRESLISMGEARYTQATWQAIATMLHNANFRAVNPAGIYAS